MRGFMLELFDGVVSLQKNSFIDFPGTASAVLFFNGCNLKCPYCHNSALACGKESRTVEPDDIVEFLMKRRKFLDGVVVTGGEPTLYKTLPALVDFLKNRLTYKVKLDSNGLNPNMLEKVNFDYLAMDLKTSIPNYHNMLGYNSNAEEKLKRSIEILKGMGKNGEIRITAAPGVVSKEIITEMLPFLEGVEKVFIQPFNPNHEVLDREFFEERVNFEPEELTEFASIIGEVVGSCKVRGA
jgi:pyruvate formate lyase activating enzyme